MKPTQKQIEVEIKNLQEIAPKVRRHSAFGDDNRAAVEAQIEVLKERMDEDAIYDRADENKAAEEELWAESVKESALEARRWLDGDEDTTPSKGWEGLVS